MSFIEKFKGKISHLGKDGLASLFQNPDHPIFKDYSSKPKLKIITSTKKIKLKMIPSEPITPSNRVLKGGLAPSVTPSAKLDSSRSMFERKADSMLRKNFSIQIRRKNEGMTSPKELSYFSDKDEIQKPKPHSFIIKKKIEQKKEEGGGGGRRTEEGGGRKMEEGVGRRMEEVGGRRLEEGGERKMEEGGGRRVEEGGGRKMEGEGRKKREEGREEEEGRMRGIEESQKRIISYLENLEMYGGRVI